MSALDLTVSLRRMSDAGTSDKGLEIDWLIIAGTVCLGFQKLLNLEGKRWVQMFNLHAVMSHTYKVLPPKHHGCLQRHLMQSQSLVIPTLLMFNACKAAEALVA